MEKKYKKREEYKEKLREFRKYIKDEELLKDVSFLDALSDWIDFLIEKKRISVMREKDIMAHMPLKIIKKLDEIKRLEITPYGFVALKKILLEETRETISFVIRIGELGLVKEDITMMMEWARLDLSKAIAGKKQKLKLEQKKHKREKIESLEELQTLPQKEMNKLIVASMFDFSPKARTKKERMDAIKNNKGKMGKARKHAEAFALTLLEATEDAGKEAQMNVFKKIGEARLEIEGAREDFRERAEEIISPEGPKRELKKARKRVLKARDRIISEKDNLIRDLSKAGKMFDIARKDMIEKRKELDVETGEKRVYIRKQAREQINLGKNIIDKAKVHLAEERTGADILFREGRRYLEMAEKHMREEKAGTEDLFKIGRGHLTFAKKHLEDEKTGLEKKQEQAKDIIYSMEIRLEKERKRGESWVKREKERIGVIESNLTERRRKEEERLELIKKDLVLRGKETAEKSREKLKGVVVSPPGKKHSFGKAPQKKEIQDKFEGVRNKVEEDLEKRRGLIQYDLRFKRDELRGMAETQKESMESKLEAFQEKQRKLITRYRAQRKANMIRTLLKAMRSMK
jgi:hypothetical protein